jgi:hypothetical protein
VKDFENVAEENRQLRSLLKKNKTKLKEDSSALLTMTEKVDKLTLELDQLRRKSAREIEDLKLSSEESVRLAEERGRRMGQESFLRSVEGLEMIEKVRRATEKSTLRSDAFVSAVADVIPFYGGVYIEKAKARLLQKGTLDNFPEQERDDGLPDHESFNLSKEELAITEMSTDSFLDWVLSLPLEPSAVPQANPLPDDDGVDDMIMGYAKSGDDFLNFAEGNSSLPQGPSESELNNAAIEQMKSNPDRVPSHEDVPDPHPHEDSFDAL